MIDLEKLKAPFPFEKISWRTGAMTKNKDKTIGLAYIDARDLYERLDDVCGQGNWQIRYPHVSNKTCAEIGIKIDGEWIWKANGAGDSNVEADKGAFSDAAKRAGVPWGIGRYLYDMPNVWVPVDQWKKITDEGIQELKKAYAQLLKGQPSFQYTEEHKKFQRDFLYGLAKCHAIPEIISYMKAWKDDLDKAPKQISSSLNDAKDNRIKGIEGGAKFPEATYGFINVPEATDFAKEANQTIQNMICPGELVVWFGENGHKLKALDASLTAAKYQSDDGTPYERITKKYSEKIEELQPAQAAE